MVFSGKFALVIDLDWFIKINLTRIVIIG